MKNPLFDHDFLCTLDQYPIRHTHIRITSLDYNDVPLEQIEGLATGGSVNVDGASALRRTCSLSLVAPPNTIITDYHWAFKHKFKVEIGLTNFVNTDYDPIIWFPQGVFIVNSFSKSQTTSGLTISISGQDKMCRLNGTMGGAIPVEVDFAHIDEIDKDGNVTTKDILLYDTIQMAVHEYGQERKSNIIINDLDISGLELENYRGNIPLYLFYQKLDAEDADTYGSILGLLFGTSPNLTVNVVQKNGTTLSKKLTDPSFHFYKFNSLDSAANLNADVVEYPVTGLGIKKVYVIKLEYGDNAGYHQTPLTYSGDLIAKAGTVVSSGVLDKVKNMLGEYEYFYDIDGHFVFQKKKTYVNELFSPIKGEIIEPMMTFSQYSYTFNDTSMFTNIAYTPQIANVKNDFVIWGQTATGAPIHVRYAIQRKPEYYKTCGEYDKDAGKWKPNTGKRYATSNKYDCDEIVDWREIIYQMARDYSLFNQYADFYFQVDSRNVLDGEHLYPNGKTNYEQYYTDMLSFWRYLYDLHPNDAVDSYYPYQEYYSSKSTIKPGWNKLIHDNPSALVFWFDFLDVGDAPLSTFSVDAIGPRTKVENVSGNCSIYLQETPEILLTIGNETVEQTKDTTAFSTFQVSEEKRTMFNIAASAISLISKANDLIYKHACCAEGINLTCIPIYYLEPNTRIYVQDIGDLIVTKISYNLSHGGTMSLTCTKVVQSIY